MGIQVDSCVYDAQIDTYIFVVNVCELVLVALYCAFISALLWIEEIFKSLIPRYVTYTKTCHPISKAAFMEVSQCPLDVVGTSQIMDEDDTQVDSDLSKVANEIARTSIDLTDSPSETDVDDDIIDDAVEIKDNKCELSDLWVPKVTEVSSEQNNKMEEENDEHLPELEDEFMVEETLGEDDRRPNEMDTKVNSLVKVTRGMSFQHSFERSVLDATDRSPLLIKELVSPKCDAGVKSNEEGIELETKERNGNNSYERNHNEAMIDPPDAEIDQESDEVRMEKEITKLYTEDDGETEYNSESWKIDFIRVETDVESRSKTEKSLTVNGDRWNRSKLKGKMNKKKKDKNSRKTRKKSETETSGGVSCVRLDTTLVPQPRSGPVKLIESRK